MPEQNDVASAAPSLDAYWLAETLRMRESLWGPLEDAKEVRRARSEGGGFEEKILLRAQYLGERELLHPLIRRWRQGAKLALLAMCLGALFAGAAAALGALGDGSRPVNLLLALAGMLGLNTLAYLFWFMSFMAGDTGSGTWLGECWLWLTQKLARGPDAALVPRALIQVLSRNKALRWLLGSVTHALWTLVLGALLLTMLLVLSARRYSFNWETTLLSPDSFVTITTFLGWLPSKLGFAMPPEAIIRASDGLQVLPGAAQSLWSSWLIGCVVVYGVLPRLMGVAISLAMAKKNMSVIGLDAGLPGYAELRDRLSPVSEKTGVDDVAGPDFQAHIQPLSRPVYESGQPLLLGIELAADFPWPPAALAAPIADLGVIDNRVQRKTVLDQLQAHTPKKLLMVCDARQTPDRGTVALLADLASLAGEAHVSLEGYAAEDSPQQTRADAWRDKLQAAGFLPEHTHTDLHAALSWLASGPDGATPTGISQHGQA